MDRENTPDLISQSLSLAMLLEVSGSPKPGNVHRRKDHRDTRFEHFLASAVAVIPVFREAAVLGSLIGTRKRGIFSAGIGRLLLSGVQQVRRWQHDGNTVLGTLMLLIPLAIAAGMTRKRNRFSNAVLRRNLIRLVDAATPDDAVNFFRAIRLSGAGNLGTVNELDVNDPKSINKIMRNRISLRDALGLAADRDQIAREMISGYPTIFATGFSVFMREIKRGSDTNTAAVHSFLRLLAANPDSLIVRKAGLDKALEVSQTAARIIAIGGLRSRKGRVDLEKLDDTLHKSRLNPGTTADLLAASLAIAVINGYRP